MITINNQINVIGNVGLDPEQRGKTKDGSPVICFAIAQSLSTFDHETGEKTLKDAQWFRVCCFSNLANRAQLNLKKGDLVLVTGELKSRSYKTEKGEKKVGFEIIASDVLKVQRLRGKNNLATAPQAEEAIAGPSFEDWNEEVIAP
jgi:single stranded DNA-binding protein